MTQDVDPAAYAAQVWEGIHESLGELPANTHAHCDESVEAMGTTGVPAGAAAALISAQIHRSANQFGASLKHFEVMGQAIQRLAAVIEDRAEMPKVMDTMLHLKHAMATMYHDLAKLAPLAGVGDFTPAEETAEELHGAETELNEWLSTRENYGFKA